LPRNHRRAALVDGLQALSQREPLTDAGFVFADPSAAGAGEIAGMQRFQHHNQREPLVDHRMRLAAGALGGRNLRMHDAEGIVRVILHGQILLPFRPRAQLVLRDVSRHAGGLREGKSHKRETPVFAERAFR
jgi:hypothetical protein